MAKLSFCIPVETANEDPTQLVSVLLSKDDLDMEVVIAARQNVSLSADLASMASSNPKLVIASPLNAAASAQDLWSHALQAASGDWLCAARPNDMIERELTLVAQYLETNSPQIDAVAWNTLQVDPDAPLNIRQSVAIPIAYDISAFDKNVMVQNYFLWANSRAIPAMPFGLYHGMIKRSLMETVLGTMAASGRKSCLPAYEWAARVVLLANAMAFSPRPMSAMCTGTYVPPENITMTAGFPFHAGLGVTAAVAEIQYSLLKEMGSDWTGGEEAFVRACMIDCMTESNADLFAAKAQAYYEALARWHGGRYAPLFQPQYMPEQPRDIRRGLHGEALMIDRFIGGAKTPHEFYRIVRSFLAPIRLICGGAAV